MASARNVVIVGAGKHGGMLLDCLQGDERWNCTAFHDDAKAGGEFRGLPVFSTDADHLRPGQAAFIALGYPHERRALVERLRHQSVDWQTYLDRRSIVGSPEKIGVGTIVFSFCMVASTVSVGAFCYLSAYSHVGTGSTIGAFTSVMPGASVGESVIGEECVIGLKSTCLDDAALGDRVTVAPHTLVRRSVPDDALVVGSPARVIRRPATIKT